MQDLEFAFIGGGNMGRALAAALIGQGVCPPDRILLVEPDPAARAGLQELGCRVIERADGLVGGARAVILAVKPQSAQQVFAELRPLLTAEQVAISIMAGVSLAAIRDGLDHGAAVRVMPNTPAQVGLGMSVFFPDPSVTAGQLKSVAALLGSCGEVLQVSSEDAIDAATAISGSGPAYVFYFAEHWMKAAEALGFTQSEAELLVQQTLLGATTLWRQQKVPAGKLREQVTSKGGTTAAALEFFQAAEVGTRLEGGIEKAYRRAKELGAR